MMITYLNFNVNHFFSKLLNLGRIILKVGNKEDWEAYAYDVMHMSTERFVKEYSNFSLDEDESELE